jgi:hypothetical protein
MAGAPAIGRDNGSQAKCCYMSDELTIAPSTNNLG